ncbi:MAG TPA: sigma-70 family RNA polymerase sigma factor [Acidobacteriota bacterium]|nr:sigma-70 family RNA polymerase sigma factor [Acidobacteriota bacterium]
MEEKLIERCKNGDLRAFEDLYKQYGRKLYGLCLRMSGNEADAEELMQEVFVILLSKIKSFRGDARFSTWLYRITVNTCISHLRKKKIKQVSLEDEPETSGALSVEPAPMAQHETLKHGIAGLPAGYRAAVIMHDVQGLNHNEIAEIMGISVGASKSQLFKARRKLRDYLNGTLPPGAEGRSQR